MELNQQILSDLIVYMKYARYLPALKRRETWAEICGRYQHMMVEKYPKLEKDIQHWMSFVYERKVLPSMRAMQFAGAAIARNHSRIYNCAYLPVDDPSCLFGDTFSLVGWNRRWLLGSSASRGESTAHYESRQEAQVPGWR